MFSISTLGLVVPTFLFSFSCSNSKNEKSKIENSPYENFVKNNSVSLLQVYTPNKKNINNLLNKFFEDNKEPSINFFNLIRDSSITEDFQITLGTGWIFDYSYDNSSDLISYYIATNEHVLDTSIQFELGSIGSIINISIPVSSYFTDQYKLYFSQPLEDKPIVANISNIWDIDWYKTNIDTAEKFNNSVLPIGQLTDDGDIKPINQAKKFIFKLEIKKMFPFSEETYYVYYDEISEKFEYINSRYVKNNQYLVRNVKSQDFQIIKLQAKPNEMIQKDFDKINEIINENQLLSRFVYSSSDREKVYKNLTKMFNFNKEENKIDEQSSFINRLEYLIELANNNLLLSDNFRKWFLFYDYKDLLNFKKTDIVTLAGFPGQNINSIFMAKYNKKFIYATKVNNSSDEFLTRNITEQNYEGNFVLSEYDKKTNLFLPDVNLQPGSSGSMVLINNKIFSIYWGITTFNIQNNNINGSINGLCTPIFNSDWEKPSILKKYLKFISTYDENSRLLYLFQKIYNTK